MKALQSIKTDLQTFQNVDGRSVAQAFFRRLEMGPDQEVISFKTPSGYQKQTWAESYAQMLGIFQGFAKLGVQAGDRICISSQNRPEWLMTDWANLCTGVVTVPIYHSGSVDDMQFILEHCDCKVLLVEDSAQYKKAAEALQKNKRTLPIISFEPVTGALKELPVTHFSQFAPPVQSPDLDQEFRNRSEKVSAESLASIVYTSGTTGRPKGVMLNHSQFLGEMRSVRAKFQLSPEDISLSFLPFAHIFGRIEALFPIFLGLRLGFAENINTISQDIVKVNPTLLLSVPRIYEKIYAKIQSEVENSSAVKRGIFNWALGVGQAVARLRSEHKPLPLSLQIQFPIADRLVFSKIRAKLGGKISFTISGGAPLSPELCQIFHACGIKILEGYGLTETTAAICVNLVDDYEFATVGKPLPGVEIRIAADGEVQVKGAQVFNQYYKNPEASKEVFTPDGFFMTGDIGEITPRGFLRITDRKKELIVTSGGKNVAPQKLENTIKSTRFLSNGMVYGDKQKYLVALIAINDLEVRTWARAEGLPDTLSAEELTKHPKVVELVDAQMKLVNARLASYESIKRVYIVPHDFSVETGELTPSLKLKRKIIVQKYQKELDALYR